MSAIERLFFFFEAEIFIVEKTMAISAELTVSRKYLYDATAMTYPLRIL